MQIRRSTFFDLAWTLGALVLLLAWDASGLDLAVARLMGGAHGFALQHNWFLSHIVHEGARRAAWLPALWLIVGIWKPTGILRQLDRGQRVQWVAATLLALALISVLKQFSHTSCPWDLVEFGGHTPWVSHWALAADGGPGRCFPAGHASAGFAFISGYFVLRRQFPRQALLWLAGALAAGLVLGIAQQWRGAHFMSHTFWTGWLSWTLCWLVTSAMRLFRPAAEPAQPQTSALPGAQAPAK